MSTDCAELTNISFLERSLGHFIFGEALTNEADGNYDKRKAEFINDVVQNV